MAEKHEKIVSEAESQAGLEVKKIEENLKEKKNPVQATELAKYLIRNICKTATEKITGDWELRKDRKEYMRYLNRVDQVKKDAMDKIESNMERYDAIYAFATKRAEMLIMLEKNERGFAGKVGGSMDATSMSVLQSVADALKQDSAELQAMPAPDMEEEKNKLMKRLQAQAEQFEKEAEKIKDFHREQAWKVDEYIDDLNKIVEEDKKYTRAGHPNFSDVSARRAWQYMFYMKRLQADLAGSDDSRADFIMRVVDSRIKKLQPLLDYWDKKYSFDDDKAKRKKEWEEYERLEANMKRARAKVEELEAEKVPPRGELQKAKSWLAGAEQRVQEQLMLLTRTVTQTQMEQESDLVYEPAPIYAIRMGTTTVTPERPEEKEEPAAPAKQPEKIAAVQPEKKKPKAS